VVATTKPTEPFTMIPNWIVRDANLSQNAVMVYLALTSHTSSTAFCWPSHKTLAKEGRCSIASVKRALKELRAKEFIDWTIRLGEETNNQQSNVYEVKTPLAHHDLPPRSVRATPRVTMTYKEEPFKEEPLNKNKVQNTLNVDFAADDELKPKYVHRDDKLGSDKQIQFVRDAFILLHEGLPDKNDETHWSQASSAALNQEINEYWHEIAQNVRGGNSDISGDLYNELSDNGQSYVDEHVGKRSPTTPQVEKPGPTRAELDDFFRLPNETKNLTAFEGMFAATDNFSF
jgi:hypothetical protein